MTIPIQKQTMTGSREYGIGVIIFLLFFGLYFILSPKTLYGSNDGSSFAILRSMEKRTFPEISASLMPYTTYANFSVYEERFFSDRPPGLAFLSWPFYQAGRLLASRLGLEHIPESFEQSKIGIKENVHDYFPLTSLSIAFVHLLPILASAIAITLLFFILRLFTRKNSLAVIFAVLFGLGTLFVKYATVFFAHNVSVLLILLVIYQIFSKNIKTKKWPWWQFALVAFIAGVTVLMEYQLVIFIIGLVIYTLFYHRSYFQLEKSKWINRNVIISLLSGAAPIITLMLYHYLLFQNPWDTTFAHQGFYLYTHTMAGTFSGNIKEGLRGLLFSIRNHGLFIMSPIILLGILFIPIAIRKYSRELIFLLITGIAHILLIAQFKEWHGGTLYPRYIIWSSTLLYMAGSIAFTQFMEHRQKLKIMRYFIKPVLLLIFLSLGGYGIYKNMQGMGEFLTGIQTLESICPSFDFSDCGIAEYTRGLSHWPLLLFLVGSLALGLILIQLYKKKGSKIIGLLVAGAAFVVIIMNQTYMRMYNIDDWKKQTILLEENFYIWKNDQTPKRMPVTDPAKKRAYHTVKIQGRGGDVIYPDVFSQEGIVDYQLTIPKSMDALHVLAEFTMVGKKNYIQAEIIDKDRQKIPVFVIEGKEKEQRYKIDRPIQAHDTSLILRFRLFAHKESTTLADVRLHFIRIYAL